jgi:phosphoglycolate phosphatase-like HAD superfamily hydrolase
MYGVALDMDGVIFDTVEVKAAALLSVFKDRSPSKQAEIDAYNRANLGVPRTEKMCHIALKILGAGEADVQGWLGVYADALTLSNGRPSLIAGVVELFNDVEIDVFVCSSAPPAEILSNLAANALIGRAKGVFGDPVSKAEALKGLKELYGSRLCFVGDAVADRRAAHDADVRFILRSVVPPSPLDIERVVPDLRDHRQWAFG